MIKSKTRALRIDYRQVILGLIAVAGLVSVAVLAPNALQLISKWQKAKRKRQQKYYISKTIKILLADKLVSYQENNQGFKCLRLTERGKAELARYEMKKLTIKKPWRWDHRYRVIIFDIKEFKRKTRDQLRRWLEHLGFVRLQNSVWVHPYDCREVIVLLKSYFKIGSEVLFLTVDSIENDKWLRENFDLPIDNIH